MINLCDKVSMTEEAPIQFHNRSENSPLYREHSRSEMQHMVETTILAAEHGGTIVKNYFGDLLDIEEKTMVSDFRTKADTEAENAILHVLTKNFPQYNILSEEAGFLDHHSEYTFVIDPLDGSNNFVLGIPNFSDL